MMVGQVRVMIMIIFTSPKSFDDKRHLVGLQSIHLLLNLYLITFSLLEKSIFFIGSSTLTVKTHFSKVESRRKFDCQYRVSNNKRNCSVLSFERKWSLVIERFSRYCFYNFLFYICCVSNPDNLFRQKSIAI